MEISHKDILSSVPKEDLICPITNQFLLEPVLGPDGIFYERKAIEKWLKKNKTSPISRMPMTIAQLNPCTFMSQIMEKYFIIHPEEKINQYTISKKHEDNIDEINNILTIAESEENSDTANSVYKKLLKYNNYKIELIYKKKNNNLNKNSFAHMVENGPIDVIKHVIDNSMDLDFQNGNKKWSAVHYICKYGSPEVVDHILDKKNINLSQKTKLGWMPLHLVCLYGSFDNITKIFEKNVDFKAKVPSYKNINHELGIQELIVINEIINVPDTVKLIEFVASEKIKIGLPR